MQARARRQVPNGYIEKRMECAPERPQYDHPVRYVVCSSSVVIVVIATVAAIIVPTTNREVEQNGGRIKNLRLIKSMGILANKILLEITYAKFLLQHFFRYSLYLF